jgi:drug/metabolite transporter (DMT)-like permease
MSGVASRGGSLRWKADLALAGCTLIWGATFVIVKDALADASTLVFIAVRFIFAPLLLAIIFWRTLAKTTAKETLAGISIGLFMFAGYVFQTAGLLYTTPSKAAFITGTSVVMVPVLHAIFWRSRIGMWVIAGVIAATIGLYFLTVPPAGFTHLNRGDILVFGCAISFAMHILVVGHFSPKYSPGALAFHQIATTGVLAWIALPIASAAHWEAPRFHSTPQLWVAIFVTAVLATDLCFYVQVWGQQHTSPTHTAILFSLEPVFAWLTSYLLVGERLSHRALVGAVLILAGIILAEMRSPTAAAPESPG